MKVTVEDISTVKKVLHIEVPKDQVVSELDKAYTELKKGAKVKGFRPGKAPKSVLKRLYKKDVESDVTSRLIQESLVEALKETELNMIGSPNLEPPEIDEENDYAYDATIEINPDIDDIDFKGLSLEKTLYNVTDEEKEAQLIMLQRNLATMKTVEEDRAVVDSDHALIDFEGFKDGKPFEATAKTENFIIKMGDSKIHADVDAAIIGMKKGENKTVEVSFPDDYVDKELAGQDIRFDITLNEIREQEFPPIDDELAKKMGPYETLDDLKGAIHTNLEEGYTKRSEQELNEQIFTTLLERSEFEVPETLVEMELQAILDDAERSFQHNNMSMEDVGITREGLSEKYRETAEKQVRRFLILGKIIDQEKLDLADDALENSFADMAKTYNQPVEGIKAFYNQNPDKIRNLEHSLLEKQAVKLIMDNSTIEEKAPEKEQDPEAEDAAGK
jgi:trigger factor